MKLILKNTARRLIYNNRVAVSVGERMKKEEERGKPHGITLPNKLPEGSFVDIRQIKTTWLIVRKIL